MDFKKLFRKDDKAVSPVIGVILMVAITVILAAAIGSSVFSKGTTESAPQASLDIKGAGVSSSVASIKIEHLGGDPIHFEDDAVTKVTASVNGGGSVEINADGLGTDDITTDDDGLGNMNVGDVKILKLIKASDDTTALQDSTGGTDHAIVSGDTVNIKVIDVQTNQLICDKEVRF
ncbi:type IV pilin [Methanosarcina sp. DH1]|uniref:type IV pilin n=1 Tax=Methanosarcina sp. DH1 TaxID=2605695 RepID=UPI001E3EF2C4|nr:type IV pilin [Methanosarcina sp. DH1]MCC4765863.1 type IV pilin [Methanosarcina sp. DH1]